MFDFQIVGGTTGREIITTSRSEIVSIVRQAYLTHHAGDSINPKSYFLRFPKKPGSRIIALPAYLGGEYAVAGIKWIGSFPDNIQENIPRASAVLLLNSYDTGYPFACMEASQISAARTAASAVLGAEVLVGSTLSEKLAVIGCGIIARNIVEFFAAQKWKINTVSTFDRSPDHAESLAGYTSTVIGYAASPVSSLEEAIDGADVVVLATTASEPYITGEDVFSAGQVVLNVSLRDIDPRIIGAAYNILDDIDHCLTANTSVHLAEQLTRKRDFIDGTLAQLILGEISLGNERPKIFSPFGLGVLDIAVGCFVYEKAVAARKSVSIEGFFGETERWAS
jgi:2,3-diaminopropionate biosynthesis protein SbnB